MMNNGNQFFKRGANGVTMQGDFDPPVMSKTTITKTARQPALVWQVRACAGRKLTYHAKADT